MSEPHKIETDNIRFVTIVCSSTMIIAIDDLGDTYKYFENLKEEEGEIEFRPLTPHDVENEVTPLGLSPLIHIYRYVIVCGVQLKLQSTLNLLKFMLREFQ